MQITVLRNGQKYGPYSIEQVQAYLQRGDLSAADLAWREGLNEWLPLSVVLGAAAPVVGAVPPPPPAEVERPQRAHGQPASQAPAGDGTVRHAGFWYRALALLIDTVIAAIVAVIIAAPLGFALGASMAGSAEMGEITTAGEILGNIVGAIVSWLYFTISESSSWQATLGKKMLGLRVTDEAGQRIGFGRANGRYWAKILSALTLCIGYMMAGWTERKQGLHDKIAGTLVMKSA